MWMTTARSRCRPIPANYSPPASCVSHPGVNRLAFKSEYREGALMHPVEELSLDKTLETLYAQGTLPKRERPLGGEASIAQTFYVLLAGELGTVDDA